MCVAYEHAEQKLTAGVLPGRCYKSKAKPYNTCIAPQAAYRSCSGGVHVTDRAGVQPIGCRLSLRPQTDLRPTNRTPPWSAV